MQRGLTPLALVREPEDPDPTAQAEQQEQEAASYLELYGFARAPFAAEAGEGGFVLGESHRSALEAMAGAMIANRSWIVLTGDPQTGKSNVLDTAVALVARRELKVLRISNQRSGPLSLKRLLSQVLGIEEPASLAQAESDRAHAILTARPVGAAHTVLAIDDAETLSLGALRYLTQICRRGNIGGTVPQVVFVGTPSFWALLRQDEFRILLERASVRLRISRLTAVEARNYIERRLWMAGSETRKVLSPQALTEVVTRTEGIPGRINAALEKVFAAGFEQGHQRVTPQTVRSALGVSRPPTTRRPSSSAAPPIWLIAGTSLAVGLGALLYVNRDSLSDWGNLLGSLDQLLPTLPTTRHLGGKTTP
jgi:general secretion pathway protein A